jgi:2-keto-4-pentenoate hydratase/2-oxohepta-3-ene-1,7-dioic acid hydratase in catechol pathway
MKIVRFVLKSSPLKVPRLGAWQEGRVIDLAAAYRQLLLEKGQSSEKGALRLAETLLPEDLVNFLENGRPAMEAAREALQFAMTPPASRRQYPFIHAQEHIRLLPPIEKPSNLRDFISFETHIRNARKTRGQDVPPAWYEIPAYYKGNTSTIIGPDDEVIWPSYTEKMDYELEFACVIGKEGQDISAEEAEEFIVGYMIMNDFSARDIQAKEMSVGLGPAKGKDFATALGPYLVTKDEIPDPYQLNMRAYVNGELWTKGTTGDMYRKFPEIISYVSTGERIVPGDVFGSGTVGWGCGLELGKFLKEGDLVELEVEGLGVLRNRIGKKQKK